MRLRPAYHPRMQTAATPSPSGIRVTVRQVTPALAAGVRALRVAPEQYPFVGDVQDNLIHALACPRSEAMAILRGDPVIGFYRIDFAPQVASLDALGGAYAGLRAMMIDRDSQGRGLGTRALDACCADLRLRHPRLRLLALNVNCANPAAIRAYRKAGFVDTGELHFGGRAGPQHLMVRWLQPPPSAGPH